MNKVARIALLSLAILAIAAPVHAQYYGAPTVISGAATEVAGQSATLHGTLTPNGTATTYWFEYGISQTLGGRTPDQYAQGYATVSVAAYLSGLNTQTTYYYRIAARNDAGTNFGTILTFTTSNNQNQWYGWGNQGTTCSAGTATTTRLPSVSGNSATVSGVVYSPSGSNISYFFEYGGTQNFGLTTPSQVVYGAYGQVTVQATLFNLPPYSTVYYRLVVQNSCGSPSYGTTESFTSGQGIGVYLPGTNYGYNTSNPYGTYAPYYGNTTYPYGTTYDPYYTNTYTNPIYTTGYNTYPYTNGYGTKPTVTTGMPEAVTQNSVRLTGTVAPNGSEATAWFVYGTSANPTKRLTSQSVGTDGIAPRTTTLSGLLRAGTTYYYRLVAENQYGVTQGEVRSFTTTGIAPTTNPSTPPAQTVTSTEPTQQTQTSTSPWSYLPSLTLPWTNTNTSATGTPMITLTPSLDADVAHIGDTVRYTLAYKNTGNGPAGNAVIHIVMPASLEYKTSRPALLSRNENNLDFSIGTIGAGSSGNLVIDFIVRESATVGSVDQIGAVIEYDAQGKKQGTSTALGTTIGEKNSSFFANIGEAFSSIPGYAWFFIFVLIVLLMMTYLFFKRLKNGGADDHAPHH